MTNPTILGQELAKDLAVKIFQTKRIQELGTNYGVGEFGPR